MSPRQITLTDFERLLLLQTLKTLRKRITDGEYVYKQPEGEMPQRWERVVTEEHQKYVTIVDALIRKMEDSSNEPK